MNRYIQSILINAGLVLVLGISAASMSSAAHAHKTTIEPTNYAMHIDEISPAPAIGQSTAVLKNKLKATGGATF